MHVRTLAEVGERSWLRKLQRLLDAQRAAPGSALLRGIGDDAAVLRVTGHDPRLVVSTDALIEDVHFRCATISMRDLGHKALAVNLSDLAAMGATPVAAFLSLSLPGSTPVREMDALLRGVRDEGLKWNCPLAGGDLTRSPQLCLCVTVIGRLAEVAAAAREKKSAALALTLRRDAARAGDLVFVTGWPGESGAGLHALEQGLAVPPALLRRHRRPTPRLRESALLVQWMQQGVRIAGLDVSDGIWNDARQMADASGVAMHLQSEVFNYSPTLQRFCRAIGLDPRRFFLFGGEDYELLITLPRDRAVDLMNEWYAPANRGLAPLSCIGRMVAGPPRVHLMDHAREIPTADGTFRHF